MTTWLGQVAAAPAGDGESGWRGGRSDGGLQGDLVAESLQLADMVALAAVGVDTGVVEAGSPPSPRGHELSYDQADWLTRQLDLGTDGTCNQDDRRITNSFWATGWERQRDTDKANSACAWAGKQTTTWTHFDNGKLKTLETLANRGGTDELTKSHEVGYLDNGVYVNGHRVSDHYLLKRQEGNTATTCVCRRPPPVTRSGPTTHAIGCCATSSAPPRPPPTPWTRPPSSRATPRSGRATSPPRTTAPSGACAAIWATSSTSSPSTALSPPSTGTTRWAAWTASPGRRLTG